MPPLLLHSILQPRALGSQDSTYEGPSSNEQTGKQGTKIGVILGCVFIVTLGTVFAIVGLLVRRKRKRDAGSTARGTRIHDLQSEELVPWLTRGSQGPNFEPHYDLLLPPSTPGFVPADLLPSPGNSRLPMNGHHSAEASQSSTAGVLATEPMNGGTEGEGREEISTSARQATGDSARSLPPPYSLDTNGVGTNLNQR